MKKLSNKLLIKMSDQEIYEYIAENIGINIELMSEWIDNYLDITIERITDYDIEDRKGILQENGDNEVFVYVMEKVMETINGNYIFYGGSYSIEEIINELKEYNYFTMKMDQNWTITAIEKSNGCDSIYEWVIENNIMYYSYNEETEKYIHNELPDIEYDNVYEIFDIVVYTLQPFLND